MSFLYYPKKFTGLIGFGMGLEWCEWQFHRFFPIVRWKIRGEREWRYDVSYDWPAVSTDENGRAVED